MESNRERLRPMVSYTPTMSEEEHKDAREKILNVWPHHKFPCEICDSEEWVLAGDLVRSPIFSPDGYVFGGHSYPQCMMVCSKCGNTKFLNAVVLGVIPREIPD